MKQRKVLNNGFVKLTNIDTTNFLEFYIKCPIFVVNQWTQNGFVVKQEGEPEFYIPAYFRKQTNKNENLSEQMCNELQGRLQNFYYQTHNFYKKLLDKGVSKEQAQTILPLGTYVQLYWATSVTELMNFLKLYFKAEQSEVREYARAILDIFEEKFPSLAHAFIEKELRDR
jgi:thymidylate synthase ThyX